MQCMQRRLLHQPADLSLAADVTETSSGDRRGPSIASESVMSVHGPFGITYLCGELQPHSHSFGFRSPSAYKSGPESPPGE
jgi:hypothetical protein